MSTTPGGWKVKLRGHWRGIPPGRPGSEKIRGGQGKQTFLCPFFPTCQVRVVRFCHSCCPPPSPPPPPLHQLPPPLPPCQLFAKLFANFRAQCALLDLNLGPAELSAHRWTSTWDLPSSVRTAGPQRPDRMPDRMSDRMSDRMPDKMP